MNQLPVEVAQQILGYIENPCEWSLANRSVYQTLHQPEFVLAWLQSQTSNRLHTFLDEIPPLIPIVFSLPVLRRLLAICTAARKPRHNKKIPYTVFAENAFKACMILARFDALCYVWKTYPELSQRSFDIASLAIEKHRQDILEYLIENGMEVSEALLLQAGMYIHITPLGHAHFWLYVK